MTTKGAMIAEIESDTERSDSTAIGLKVDAAIRHYQSRRFWFNESRSVTFNTVASATDYTFATIGTEFYKIDGAYLANGSEINELARVDYRELEEGPTSPAEGIPTAYAYVAKTLRLYTTPDDAYEVRLTGHVKLAPPATNTEADNSWMVEAYDLIMARAKAELYAHRWEDPTNAALMRVAEADYFHALLGKTHDKVAPGYLEATDF